MIGHWPNLDYLEESILASTSSEEGDSDAADSWVGRAMNSDEEFDEDDDRPQDGDDIDDDPLPPPLPPPLAPPAPLPAGVPASSQAVPSTATGVRTDQAFIRELLGGDSYDILDRMGIRLYFEGRRDAMSRGHGNVDELLTRWHDSTWKYH